MFRKLFCSMVVMVVGIGFVAAEEFVASITKVADGKITVQKYKKGMKGKAPEKDGDAYDIAVAPNAKVVYGTYNKEAKKFEPGDAVPEGLKNEMFTKIAEKGVTARLTTEGTGKDAKVTQIGISKKKKDAK
jgi:hypothetical protein